MENLYSQFMFLKNFRVRRRDFKVFKVNNQEVVKIQCPHYPEMCPVVCYANENHWKQFHEQCKNSGSNCEISYTDTFHFDTTDVKNTKQIIRNLCNNCKNNVK
ncbi:MAG: hypothetical protein IKP24_01655 [Alphaproteobacteria bacterium]|nr:hypothetical protein [Alphaproteobacteria bacterium]